MKKKFVLVKTLQLILFFTITAAGLAVIFTDNALYQMIGNNPSVRTLSILLWITMVLSFVFIFWDFSTNNSFKKDYRELDYAVYNDSVAGIANRYSCDAMIAKYMDQPVPDHVGCIMLQLTNLRQINAKYGHTGGNEMIQEFSNMLHAASLGICFVGRNGGDKFMALFEECDELKLNTFLTRINEQVDRNNSREDRPRIEYATGKAVSRDENVSAITQLIALADRRVTARTDSLTGFNNRASCDDIINLYLEKELPEHMSCVMLDIVNIREINDTWGHLKGNNVILSFGDILREAANDLCFVGRNGGTKFLAIFEDDSEGRLKKFLDAVSDKKVAYEKQENAVPFTYKYGIATHADNPLATVNMLVAQADRRLRTGMEGV